MASKYSVPGLNGPLKVLKEPTWNRAYFHHVSRTMPSSEVTAEWQFRGSGESKKDSKTSPLSTLAPISTTKLWPSYLFLPLIPKLFHKVCQVWENILQVNPEVQKEMICPPPQIQTIYSREQLCFSETRLIFKKMALELYYASDTQTSPYTLPVWFSNWAFILSKICIWHHEFSCSSKLLFNIYVLALLCELFRVLLYCGL